MNLKRAWAVTIRQFYNLKHSWDRLSDGIYWPAFDIIVWGLTSQYFSQGQSTSHAVLLILTGIIFFQVIWRAQYDVTVSLLEEIWSVNLVNLFSSPLLLNEWVLGVFFLAFLKMLGTVIFTALLSWLLYAVNITILGWYLIPFIADLLMVGWWIGLLVSGVVFLYGRKIQTLAWVGASFIVPFSAVYYPLSSLPDWAQIVARFLPSSYIFEAMRQAISQQVFPIKLFSISLVINLIYFGLSWLFFKWCFKKRLEKGLAHLE